MKSNKLDSKGRFGWIFMKIFHDSFFVTTSFFSLSLFCLSSCVHYNETTHTHTHNSVVDGIGLSMRFSQRCYSINGFVLFILFSELWTKKKFNHFWAGSSCLSLTLSSIGRCPRYVVILNRKNEISYICCAVWVEGKVNRTVLFQRIDSVLFVVVFIVGPSGWLVHWNI